MPSRNHKPSKPTGFAALTSGEAARVPVTLTVSLPGGITVSGTDVEDVLLLCLSLVAALEAQA